MGVENIELIYFLNKLVSLETGVAEFVIKNTQFCGYNFLSTLNGFRDIEQNVYSTVELFL